MTERAADEKVELLRRTAVFGRVGDGPLRTLAEMARTERFGRGEVVCEIGDPAAEVWIVASGRVQVSGATGQALRALEPGAVLGEYGMLGDGVRTARVVADGETELLSVPYDAFRAFLLEFPDALFTLLEVAVQRLREAERRAAFTPR